jgi:hypothetical protein
MVLRKILWGMLYLGIHSLGATHVDVAVLKDADHADSGKMCSSTSASLDGTDGSVGSDEMFQPLRPAKTPLKPLPLGDESDSTSDSSDETDGSVGEMFQPLRFVEQSVDRPPAIPELFSPVSSEISDSASDSSDETDESAGDDETARATKPSEIRKLTPIQVADLLYQSDADGTINGNILIIWDVDNTLLKEGSDMMLSGAVPINPEFSKFIAKTQEKGFRHIALTNGGARYKTNFSSFPFDSEKMFPLHDRSNP